MNNTNSISLLKFWVSHAIMLNVRQIKLDLSYAGLVEFPENSLALKTLEVLNLRVKIFFFVLFLLMESVFQVSRFLMFKYLISVTV